jgi:hypothetical protein
MIVLSKQQVFSLNLVNVQGCPCCELPLETEGIVKKYPLCVNTRKLDSLGCGTYLYFYFYKFTACILLICLFLVTVEQILFSLRLFENLQAYCSIEGLVLNYTQNLTCLKYNQTIDWLYIMSYENLYNYKSFIDESIIDPYKTTIDLNIINCVTMILLYFANIGAIIDVYLYLKEYDESRITPQDYTLMISNVPIYKDKKDLINFLSVENHQYMEVKDEQTGLSKFEMCEVLIQPIDVITTYKTYDIMKLKRRLIRVNKRIKYCNRLKLTYYTTGVCCCRREHSLDYLYNKMNILRNLIKDQIKLINTEERMETGVVFAVFNYQWMKDLYLSKFPRSFVNRLLTKTVYYWKGLMCCCKNYNKKNKLHQHLIKVEPAPEPKDIIWENLQFSTSQKLQSAICVYGLSIGLIGLSFGMIIGLNVSGRFTFDNIPLNYSLSITISLLIMIINLIISSLLRKLSENERYATLAAFHLTNSLKLTIVNAL